MPKRFTDTDKWKKPFIRGLQAPYKLLWLYICDDCDHSGIWQVDIEVAQLRIGEKLDEKKALQFFAGKIIPIDGGTKWFIPSFIEFQYPSGLSANNKAHTGIIKNLEKYKNEIDSYKPLESPLQGDKDMDKDKDKVMDKEKVKDKKPKIEIVFPFNSEKFLQLWDVWKDYKSREHGFRFKSAASEQASLNELVKLAKGFEHTACLIIEQSLAKGWKGFFELKNDTNGTTKTHQTGNNHVTDEQLHKAFAKRFGNGQ